MAPRTIAALACIAASSLAACTEYANDLHGIRFEHCDRDSATPRCRYDATAGSIGGGPIWSTREVLRNGFVDGGRLVVAVSSLVWEPGTPGSIYAIDLVTGDRTLVSGTLHDARVGDRTVGSGPPLDNVIDVQPSRDAWFAVTDQAIVRVDPSTGDRSAFYAWTYGPSPPRAGLAVASDGTVFTCGMRSGAPAIVAIDANGERFVSAGGAQPIGSGPDFGAPAWFAISNTTLYVADASDASILAVDVRSGDRVRVSSSSSQHRVGDGDDATVGENPITLAPGGLWSYGADGALWIDTTTGSRAGKAIASGPRGIMSYGSPRFAAWHHPTLPVLYATQEVGVIVVDALTGDANWLSR